MERMKTVRLSPGEIQMLLESLDAVAWGASPGSRGSGSPIFGKQAAKLRAKLTGDKPVAPAAAGLSYRQAAEKFAAGGTADDLFERGRAILRDSKTEVTK